MLVRRVAALIGAIAFLGLLLDSRVSGQTSRSSDEQLIRAAIAEIDRTAMMPFASDRVFWIGAYKKPRIARDPGEPISEAYVLQRVPGTQKVKTTVGVLRFSQGADMAWEHSDMEVSFQVKGRDGRTRDDTFMTSLLRVWERREGKWQIAAFYNFAHDEPARLRNQIAEEIRSAAPAR